MGTFQNQEKMMSFFLMAVFGSSCWRGFFRRPPEMGHRDAVLERPGGRNVESWFDAVFLLAVGVSGSFAQLD
eukprot:3132044-Prorocentrum_lima.AAC.1